MDDTNQKEENVARQALVNKPKTDADADAWEPDSYKYQPINIRGIPTTFKWDDSNPNMTGPGGATALWCALNETMDWGEAVRLLELGADPNFILDGDPLLFNAIQKGCPLEVLISMKEHGADLTVKDRNGEGLMHAAAQTRSQKLIRWLYLNGVEMDVPAPSGVTPLCYAAESGSLEATGELLSLGANPRPEWPTMNPLHLACGSQEKGSEKTVALLLNLGGRDVNAETMGVSTPMSTPMILAASGRAPLEKMKLLLDAGYSARVSDRYGFTPLSMLVKEFEHSKPTQEFMKVVELLLKNGVDTTKKVHGKEAWEMATNLNVGEIIKSACEKAIMDRDTADFKAKKGMKRI